MAIFNVKSLQQHFLSEDVSLVSQLHKLLGIGAPASRMSRQAVLPFPGNLQFKMSVLQPVVPSIAGAGFPQSWKTRGF